MLITKSELFSLPKKRDTGTSRYIEMSDPNTLWGNISTERFNDFLSRYPSLIESISSEKAPKAGQSSLLELDDYRYNAAIDAFRSKKPKRRMAHDDVKKLVEWKLRHGKFRPTLMKLVSSNDGDSVKTTIQDALAQYWSENNVSKAIDAIAKLKGIGPATASLLLSVHDPDRVIFFSDEAFWWLCSGGQKSVIKYTAKEYQQLNDVAGKLARRLEVAATDVEKVAYVVMKDGSTTTSTEPRAKLPPVKKEKVNDKKAEQKVAGKRKSSQDTDTKDGPLRRSQRQKTS
ncbi:hypothetical protein F4777DRAFT_535613 [Nemania sp. FL0916]|nr:hypothetical protein F4777DRAFT_535613 [Nemania sp. FL0916]